jgi:hypothetical protein
MAIKILIAVAVVVGLLVLLVASRPSAFNVERSITVAAPPEVVFGWVDDLHAWRAWSPWEKKDPDMKRTFEGPAAGDGASYAWAGDRNVGEGRMTIERSERPSRIGIRLEFFKPFAGTNHSDFSFTPVPGGTRVTWTMDGHINFAAKAFTLFVTMDKMIGGDFEAGLAALKGVAEGAGSAEGAGAAR